MLVATLNKGGFFVPEYKVVTPIIVSANKLLTSDF